MILKDLLGKIESQTPIVVRNAGTGEKSFVVFEGKAEDVPYWLADDPIGYEDCIEVIDGCLDITTGTPKPRNGKKTEERTEKTVSNWMDGMDEEEVLKWIICFLYHYDSGTVRFEPENFSETEWQMTFESAIDYFQGRLAQVCVDKSISDWFRKPSPKMSASTEDKQEKK